MPDTAPKTTPDHPAQATAPPEPRALAEPHAVAEPCTGLIAQDAAARDPHALCRALEHSLVILAGLVEAATAADRAHHTEELRALLERVARQAAALQALVAAALNPAVCMSRPAAAAAAAAAAISRADTATVTDTATPAIVATATTRTATVTTAAGTFANPAPRTVAALTAREHEILTLISQGLASKEVAHRLGITSATVRTHVQNILTKLGVCNRRQAAALLTGRLPHPARSRLHAARRAHPLPPATPAARASPGMAAVAPSANPVSPFLRLTRLTGREIQVLRCLAAGLGRVEIAERLYVSPHTARTHIQRVLSKLGVHSALAAMAVAREVGLSATA